MPAVAATAIWACSDDNRGGDPVLAGLDQRPANASCVAPERDNVTANVEAPAAFPALAFDAPLAMLQAPGDASRWFVVEQAGRIRVFANDEAVPAATDFLDLRGRVHVSPQSGLLGLAFHPDFSTNGRAFVSYVAQAGGGFRLVVAEFSSPDGGLTLDPGSERVLLSVAQEAASRNGGALAFGLDGFLYISVGDGGAIEEGLSQDPATLAGKMLRIDVATAAPGLSYGVPSDNPFASSGFCGQGSTDAGSCAEIYALGFRDPRRWSFDPVTGVLWLPESGKSGSEQVHVVELGGDYGSAEPLAAYAEELGDSIAGGYVYRGSQVPALRGRYVFADAGSGLLGALRPDGGGGYLIEQFVRPGATPAGAPGPLEISAFGQDADGELYVLDHGRGAVRRLLFTAGSGSDNVSDLLSETGCIDVAAAGAPELDSLIPYGLNAAFWSDGAAKDRWLGLPDGQNILVPDDGDWDLPIGTVIVKHFRLNGRLAETRLFMRHPDGGWAGYTYRWNEQQTEATRVRGGLVAPVGDQDWVYPSESDCMFCHNKAAGYSLGLETAQLNGDHAYPQTGRTSNQLATLNAINALTPPITGEPPAYADPADTSLPLEARARSYLHANCSFCHRPGGPTPAQMDLRHDTPLPATGACDAVPTLGDLGIADARIVAPGDPDRSELLSRMSRRDFAGMPPVASRLPDMAGASLIREWIESLTSDRCD
jgi:uncharacterized repeat protein (TIGR03806 family)